MNKQLYIHIDADAFFASVEQCLHRELRHKPIVTGRDGSIAVAMSYEAKRLGIERATPIHEIREKFPQVQMVASDYYMYKIFSDRMLSIIKGELPDIKRKSIDECSGALGRNIDSYSQAKDFAQNLKEILEKKLGCSFSIGISSSPLLAKMASGMNKPSGLTLIDPDSNTDYYDTPIKQVSGLGTKLCYRLSQLGVMRIRDFVEKYPLIRKNFSITVDDIYYQLQGLPSCRNLSEKPQQSMNRARSFKSSSRKDEIWGQLMLNYEHLMRKMRNQNLCCTRVYISLRDFDRKSSSGNMGLAESTRDSQILMLYVQSLFNKLYHQGYSYRYVSITFSGLRTMEVQQMNLFENVHQEPRHEKIYSMIDILDAKFGVSTISMASTLILPKKLGSHIDQRQYPIVFPHPLLPEESINKRLAYPFLGKI